MVLEYDGAVEAAVSHGEWDEAFSGSDMVDLWLRWMFLTSFSSFLLHFKLIPSHLGSERDKADTVQE